MPLPDGFFDSDITIHVHPDVYGMALKIVTDVMRPIDRIFGEGSVTVVSDTFVPKDKWFLTNRRGQMVVAELGEVPA